MTVERSILERTPRIAVTPYCNLNCIYCDGATRSDTKPGAMEDFRRTSLDKGVIEKTILMDIIKNLYWVGFRGITLTGGEPLIRPDWDTIINQSRELGMERAEVTTNGTLIASYLDKKGELPAGLTLLKVSFDSASPGRFKEITGGDIEEVIDGVRFASQHVITRANKVILRSDMSNLMEYLESCQEIGFSEVNLLDLMFYPNRDSQAVREFYEREYVPFEELAKFLQQQEDIEFKPHKYGHETVFSSSLKILVKDSNITIRDGQCRDCRLFCQEGKFTIRIATDGNITQCPDYRAELPSIDGVEELSQGTLFGRLDNLVSSFLVADEMETLQRFLDFHNLTLISK